LHNGDWIGAMAVERTLTLLKPDATRRNLTDAINADFEEARLRVVASTRHIPSKVREQETELPFVLNR